MGSRLFEGVRRSDVAVVVVLAAIGVYLMVENVNTYDQDLRIDSHSWLLVPVWLAAVLPLLWWRRNPLAVAVLVTVVMAGHLLRSAGWPAAARGCRWPGWSRSWSAPATPCAARSPAWLWPRCWPPSPSSATPRPVPTSSRSW